MKLLAVDTSTPFGSVAILDGDSVIERRLDLALSHTERLLPAIEELLIQAQLQLSDLDGLAVAVGPGSFTGLRIGLATMKAFAQGSGLPLAGISTLEALAYNGRESVEPVAAVVDAKRKEVFFALYQFVNGEMRETLLQEQVSKPSEAAALLKNFGTVRVVGDGVGAYPEIFGKEFPFEVDYEVHAGQIAKLALSRLPKKGEGLELTLNYIRKSDAELVTTCR